MSNTRLSIIILLALLTITLLPPATVWSDSTTPTLEWMYDVENESVYDIAWSPDGSSLAVGLVWDDGNSSGAELLDDSGGVVWRTGNLSLGQGDIPQGIAWSSDSTRIAFAVNNTVYVLDAGNGGVIGKRVLPENEYYQDMVWSGSRLLVLSIMEDYAGSGTREYAILRDILGDSVEANITLGENSSQVMLLSPDASRILIIPYNNTVQVYSVASGSLVFEAPLPDENSIVMAASWSPDSRRIAVATDNNEIYIIDSAGGETVEAKPRLAPGDSVGRITWNSDSTAVAYAAIEGYGVVGVDGSQMLYKSYERLGSPTSIAWSPSGGEIAVGGYTGVLTYSGEYPVAIIEVYSLAGPQNSGGGGDSITAPAAGETTIVQEYTEELSLENESVEANITFGFKLAKTSVSVNGAVSPGLAIIASLEIESLQGTPKCIQLNYYLNKSLVSGSAENIRVEGAEASIIEGPTTYVISICIPNPREATVYNHTILFPSSIPGDEAGNYMSYNAIIIPQQGEASTTSTTHENTGAGTTAANTGASESTSGGSGASTPSSILDKLSGPARQNPIIAVILLLLILAVIARIARR